MDDFFHKLSAGARFKDRRVRERSGLAQPADFDAVTPAASGDVIGSLDFFGDETPAPKRRKQGAAEGGAPAPGSQKEHPSHAAADDAPAARAPQSAGALRRAHRIKVSDGAPPPISTSDELAALPGVRAYLSRNVTQAGYTTLTPVQMQCIPAMLGGRDVLVCAPTGSGKTAAYLLPLLARLRAPAKRGVRGLVVAPTRELAQQIHRELSRLAEGPRFGLCVLAKPAAVRGKERPVAWRKHDVLVSTPLRLVHLLANAQLSLGAVSVVVLDEADRLLELGFVEQVDEVLAACEGAEVQRAMFSATIPPAVEELARSVLRDPLAITVGERNAAAHDVEQRLVYVGREDGKILAMKQLVQEGLTPPVLIFVQSKERADQLFRMLVYANVNADVMHAQRTAAQREAVVSGLRAGRIWVLITTELMARGIDFKGVSLVINYDIPTTTQSYIHRVGRTGRAGRRGRAITFFTDADVEFLRPIANVIKASGSEVPEWLLSVRRPKQGRRRQLAKKPVSRKSIQPGGAAVAS